MRGKRKENERRSFAECDLPTPGKRGAAPDPLRSEISNLRSQIEQIRTVAARAEARAKQRRL